MTCTPVSTHCRHLCIYVCPNLQHLIPGKDLVDLLFNTHTHTQSGEHLQEFKIFFLLTCVPTATMFTLKNSAEEGMEGDGDEEEDDFQTDEEEEMEVDKQTLQKRKKVSEN